MIILESHKLCNKIFIGILTTSFILLQTHQSISGISINLFNWIHANFPGSFGGILSAIFWIGAAPIAIFLPFLIFLSSMRTALLLGGFFVTFSCITSPLGNHIRSIEQGGPGLTAKTAILNAASIAVVSCILLILLLLIPRAIINLTQRKK